MRRESPAGACYPLIKKGHPIGKPPVFWKRPVTFRGMTGPCPGWVKNGSGGISRTCRLFPQQRTFVEASGTSALCQRRTSRHLIRSPRRGDTLLSGRLNRTLEDRHVPMSGTLDGAIRKEPRPPNYWRARHRYTGYNCAARAAFSDLMK